MKHFTGSIIFTILMLSSMSISLAAEEATGWLEGTVKDESGNPLDKWVVQVYNSDGSKVYNKDRQELWAYSTGSQGGFYSIRNLKPNVYEVRIFASQGYPSERENELLPQRLFGVAINTGVRSILNIKLKEGKSRDFVEVGKPNVQTQKVMLLTEEIDRLKKQVKELEKTSGDSTN